MVTTTASYDNPLYQALPGLGYDGIGALLYDGGSLPDGAASLIAARTIVNDH